MNRLITLLLVIPFFALQPHAAMAKSRDKKKPDQETAVSSDEKKDVKHGSLVVKNQMGESLAGGSISVRATRTGTRIPLFLQLKDGEPTPLPVGEYRSVSYSLRVTQGSKNTTITMLGNKDLEIEENKSLNITLLPPKGFDIKAHHSVQEGKIKLFVSNMLSADNGITISSIHHRDGKSRPSPSSLRTVQIYTADGERLLAGGPMKYG